MTSIRQIEANRRNSLKSTGPKTDDGKRHASQNAVRHGLTAETVIVPMEDADDYGAFEQAVTADYDAETAVERELVLRLASLLWRLRRATSIETGLLQIEEEPSQTQSPGLTVARLVRPGDEPTGVQSAHGLNDPRDAQASFDVGVDMAWRFLRLADLDNGVFERLGRYESALWRQARQTLFALEGLRWRTSNASRRRAQHSWQRTMNPRLGSD
jgi:hypothetical protein